MNELSTRRLECDLEARLLPAEEAAALPAAVHHNLAHDGGCLDVSFA